MNYGDKQSLKIISSLSLKKTETTQELSANQSTNLKSNKQNDIPQNISSNLISDYSSIELIKKDSSHFLSFKGAA